VDYSSKPTKVARRKRVLAGSGGGPYPQGRGEQVPGRGRRSGGFGRVVCRGHWPL